MITYKPTTWKERIGEFKAVVTDIAVEENKFFDREKDNSTENVLNISFELEDPETLETFLFVQKYVAPLSGGNGLFQQLLDVKQILPDVEGGSVDEQTFIGMKCRVVLEKNKKGFSFIKKCVPLFHIEDPKETNAVSNDQVPTDLPF